MSRGADVNAQNNDGDTALMLVAENPLRDDEYEIASGFYINMILQRTGDINIKNKCGNTALMIALRNGYLDVVELLLTDSRVDTEAINSDGDTVPMVAKGDKIRGLILESILKDL